MGAGVEELGGNSGVGVTRQAGDRGQLGGQVFEAVHGDVDLGPEGRARGREQKFHVGQPGQGERGLLGQSMIPGYDQHEVLIEEVRRDDLANQALTVDCFEPGEFV